MLYSDYRKRMEKISYVLGVCRRFRVLIISVCLFLLALTVTLLAVKGTVTDSGSCPSQIVMGENLNCGASAVFGSVDYEYRIAGTQEWFSEQPVRPGNYEVRCVSKGVFGSNRYGSVLSFTIIPKRVEVSVSSDSVTYGELPEVTANLAYADTIYCSSFEYSDKYGATTGITPVKESIKVYDADGNDVTYSYELTAVSRNVTYLQRVIDIIVDDSEEDFVYDGTAHYSTNYHISADTPLAEGDKEELTFNDYRILAGTSENIPDVKITAGDKDITSLYKINITAGNIVVNKRPVTVVSNNMAKDYDGTPLFGTVYSVEDGSFLKEHTIEADFEGIVNAGYGENSFSLTIFDADGNDVSDNYDITYTFGQLKVNPRPITVTSSANEWEYDGSARSEISFNLSGGLVDGHKAEVTDRTYITNAGATENRIEIDILDGDESVIGNYDITYVFGTLSVTKRKVAIYTESMSFTYNGSNQSYKRYYIENLVKGHDTSINSFTELCNVGSADNVISVLFNDADGNDVTGNYGITEFYYGRLIIEQRMIFIKPVYAEKIYDGTPLTSSLTELGAISDGGLIEGHTYSIDTEGSRTDAGYGENAVVCDSLKISDKDGNDVTQNYLLYTTTEELYVIPRPITVSTSDDEKVYDGTPLERPGWAVFSDYSPAILAGHRTGSSGIYDSITDVGETENTIYGFKITAEDGRDVTDNYDITFVFGTLKVTARPVTLTSLYQSWVYDGESHYYEFFAYDEDEIAPEQSVKAWFTNKIKNVGTLDNEFYAKFYDANDKEVTDNYDIIYIFDLLEITPRPITVTAGSAEKVYDDTPLTCESFAVTEGSLVSGQEFEATFEGSQTYAGESENKIVGFTISEKGNDVTDNYEVTLKEGTLTVTRRPVTVYVNDREVIYDGEEHCTYIRICEGLLYGNPSCHWHEVINETKYTDVTNGPVLCKFEIKIYAPYTLDYADMTDNYDISYEYGYLTILPRPITVTAGSAEKVYDGTPLTSDEYKITSEYEPPIVLQQTVKAQTSGSITDVLFDGDGNILGAVNTITEFKVFDGKRDVTFNYSVTYAEGTLTVTQRHITVTAESAEKIYDGKPLTCDKYKVTSEYDPPIVLNQTAKAEVEGSVTEVQFDGDGNITGVPNKITQFSVLDGERDVTQNYSVDFVDGELIIRQRPITVETGSADKIYDGIYLSCNKYSITSALTPALAEGQYERVVITVAITDVHYENGEVAGVENTIDSIEIFASDGKEVTKNYDITEVYGTLTVYPRPVTFTAGSGEKEYDDTPLTVHTFTTASDYAPALISGHTADAVITSSARYVVYSGEEVGFTPNRIDSVTVTDASGRNVTANYKITLSDGALKITPRSATVRTGSYKWFYDGFKHSYVVCDFENLVDGQTYETPECVSITDVGTLENKVVVAIINVDGIYVTGCYSLTYEYGTLEIEPRPITVTAGSAEKVYDGKPLTCADYGTECEYGEAIVGGHTLTVVTDGSITDVLYDGDGNVAFALNTVTEYTITYNGKDVSFNYKVTTVNGTLTVYPRPVTMKPFDLEKVYDGQSFPVKNLATWEEDPEYDPTFAEGQYPVDGVFEGSGIDVGTYDYTLSGIRIVETLPDGTEIDRTSNYVITYKKATITILPRPIKVTAGSAEKVYDDTALTCGDVKLSLGEIPKFWYEYIFGPVSNVRTPLVPSHTEKVEVTGSATNVRYSETGEVIAWENSIASVTIWDGEKDVTKNYAITTVSGELKITPREITITSGSGDKPYDGKALTVNSFEATSEYEFVFPEGHSAVVEISGSITDVLFDTDGNIISAPNTVDSVKIVKGDDDVTLNYAITVVEGALTITKAEITVIANDDSKVYDGMPFNGGKYSLSYGKLPEEHFITAETVLKPVDAGNYVTCVSEGSVKVFFGEEDKTANFDISCGAEQATLKILQRDITFETASHEWDYDGEEHYDTGHSVSVSSEYGLADGHSSFVNEYTKVTDVGTVENVLDIVIKDADGGDVTHNYNILYENGELTVAQREITVRAGSAEKVYDGEALTCSTYYISSEVLLIDGHTLTATTSGSITDAGKELNSIVENSVVICDANGKDITGYYKITLEDGQLEVAPRKFTVTSESDEKVYDGTPLTNGGYEITSVYNPVKADGHSVEVTVSGSITDVFYENGEISAVENTLSVKVYDKDGKDVTHNYEPEVKAGTLKVTPLAVEFISASGEWEYDGNDHSKGTVSLKDGYSLVSGHSYKVLSFESLTDADEIANKVTVAIYDGDGKDVSGNYSVNIVYGTLKVTKRVIRIQAGDDKKVYDGLPFNGSVYTVETGSLVSGHNLSAETVLKPVNAGEYYTAVKSGSAVILSDDKNVTENYEVQYSSMAAKLTVEKREVLFDTADNEWEYDGIAHSDGTHTLSEFSENALVEGHYTKSSELAEILEIGMCDNTMTILVYDEEGNEVTDNYTVKLNCGILIVSEKQGEGPGGGGLDESGSLGGGGVGGGENKDVIVAVINSEVSGDVYLRYMSFGDYTGNGWTQASAYGGNIDGYSLNYLSGVALENAGFIRYRAKVKSLSNMLLPYYTAMGNEGYAIQTSDVKNSALVTNSYSLDYYFYDYTVNGGVNSDLGAYSSAELAYRNFVYANYLNVPSSTRAYLQTVINEKGFSADSPDIIKDVASYVQGSATYNLEYNKAMDSESDVVVSFLSKYKEGVCRHYASAGVLLFRALGIPARYTEGYAGKTVANTDSEIHGNQGHAWVEVYLNGFGWIMVEVTGGGPGGGTGGNGSGSGSGSGDNNTVTLKPKDEIKQFDGTPLTATSLEGFAPLEALGYTYDVSFGGSRTEIGESESFISSLVIYDPEGTTVYKLGDDGITSDLKIVIKKGKLTVVEETVVTVYTYSLEKEYDGLPIEIESEDYYYDGLGEGYTFELEGLEKIVLVSGSLSEEDLKQVVIPHVYDSDGNEVTERFKFAYVPDITVNLRALEITTLGATKVYDGEPLVNHNYVLGGAGLVDGHRLELTFTGTITFKGETFNTVDMESIKIVDREGNNVTHCYSIKVKTNKLTVT